MAPPPAARTTAGGRPTGLLGARRRRGRRPRWSAPTSPSSARGGGGGGRHCGHPPPPPLRPPRPPRLPPLSTRPLTRRRRRRRRLRRPHGTRGRSRRPCYWRLPYPPPRTRRAAAFGRRPQPRPIPPTLPPCGGLVPSVTAPLGGRKDIRSTDAGSGRRLSERWRPPPLMLAAADRSRRLGFWVVVSVGTAGESYPLLPAAVTAVGDGVASAVARWIILW